MEDWTDPRPGRQGAGDRVRGPKDSSEVEEGVGDEAPKSIRASRARGGRRGHLELAIAG